MNATCSTYAEKRNSCGALMGKFEGKRPLGRLRHNWEDNIKMDLREVWMHMDWIALAQGRDKGGLLQTHNEPLVSIKCGNFLTN
jgi:hypothetical protein